MSNQQHIPSNINLYCIWHIHFYSQWWNVMFKYNFKDYHLTLVITTGVKLLFQTNRLIGVQGTSWLKHFLLCTWGWQTIANKSHNDKHWIFKTDAIEDMNMGSSHIMTRSIGKQMKFWKILKLPLPPTPTTTSFANKKMEFFCRILMFFLAKYIFFYKINLFWNKKASLLVIARFHSLGTSCKKRKIARWVHTSTIGSIWKARSKIS